MRLKAYICALHAALFAILLAVSPAGSGSMMLLGAGKRSGGGVTFSLTYTDSRADSSVIASVTYNSGGDPSCGTADPNRYVVVIAGRRLTSSNAPSSVVIAGVTATLASGSFISQADATTAKVIQGAIYYAAVPTGTTCSVVINWDSGGSVFSESTVGVYRLITATPTPTVVQTAGATTDHTLTLPAYTVPVGGASVNLYTARNSTGNSTPFMTWTNTSAANGDFYLEPGARGTSGSTVQVAGSVTVTATTTQTSTNDAVIMSAAAWGP